MARVPKKCPPELAGRYTVVAGDTMFFIAQRFGISLSTLIEANPHITDPDMIFPGDVLCVPRKRPEPPPRKKDCPCPITLLDFIGRRVQVTTTCEVVTGTLVFVGDISITLLDPRTQGEIVIRCNEICFVRILRPRKELARHDI